MYNRYIPNEAVYTKIGEENEPKQSDAPDHPSGESATISAPDKPSEEKKGEGLAGILKALKLEELDTGDILLLLIMLFLFLEGDDMELVITLGLILILSL